MNRIYLQAPTLAGLARTTQGDGTPGTPGTPICATPRQPTKYVIQQNSRHTGAN